MNRIVLIVLVACLVGAAYIMLRPNQRKHELVEQAKIKNETPGWHSFKPSSGKFSVDFPVNPHHASDTINDSATQKLKRYEMYVAEGIDGSVYMVNLITYPDAQTLQEKNEIFKSFIDDMLSSNPRNQLISSSESQFNNLDGMDFQLKNDEVTITSKMFIDGPTLYVLSKVQKNTVPENNEFNKFVSSFKLPQNSANVAPKK